jgi:two-component system LytT family sensor kinase
MNLRRPIFWIRLFIFTTVVGLFSFAHFYLDDLARGQTGTLAKRLLEELTGAYAALPLIPLMWLIAGPAPKLRRAWPRFLALSVVALATYTIVHTTLMAVSRAIIAPLIGLGPYDYGNLVYRYPMEAASDAIYYGIFAIVITLAVRAQDSRAAERRASDLQRRLVEAQLENLRLQLNPHFLFNTLNAISAVMYDDVRKADAMITKLSDFLRTVLAASGVSSVPLGEELAVERQYIEIMTTRLERRLELQVSVGEGMEGALVPFMLLQPLLENSILHGMTDRPSLALEIVAVRRDGQTVIEVRDDGRGYKPVRPPGIGLSNVRSRLAHLYGASASLSLEARDEGGTRATVALPFATGAEA